jgi:hypothetical protein
MYTIVFEMSTLVHISLGIKYESGSVGRWCWGKFLRQIDKVEEAESLCAINWYRTHAYCIDASIRNPNQQGKEIFGTLSLNRIQAGEDILAR